MGSIYSDNINDSILLNQVQQGNKKAFEVLYNRYWKETYSNAFKRLKDRDLAKDIVQNVFISVWTKKEGTIDNLPAYLNMAVRNQVVKVLIKHDKTRSFLGKLNDIPAIYQEADTNICYKEFCDSYEALLLTLPPKRQLIFRLRFHEDLTTKVISDKMGITRKTVQNQLAKAIEQLKIALFS